MNVAVVLFDLDGTLSDSAAGIVSSCRHALGELGFEVDEAAVRSWIGLGLHEVMGVLGVPEGQLDRAVATYRRYYSSQGVYGCQLFDGIPAMLSALKEGGITLGVATAKAEPLAKEVLRYLGIAPYFDVVVGAALDATNVSKGDIVACAIGRLGGPSPQTVVMAGDRSYDIVGAIENGAHPVGVAWGYGTVEELVGAGAELVARDPVELAGLLVTGP
ncbi:MAG: HAD hydrolase-like protein [Acidimicrobiales bacterium]